MQILVGILAVLVTAHPNNSYAGFSAGGLPDDDPTPIPSGYAGAGTGYQTPGPLPIPSTTSQSTSAPIVIPPMPTTQPERSYSMSHALWLSYSLALSKLRIPNTGLKILSGTNGSTTTNVQCVPAGGAAPCFGNAQSCADTKLGLIQGFALDIENRANRFQTLGLPIEVGDGATTVPVSTSQAGRLPIILWYKKRFPHFPNLIVGSDTNLSVMSGGSYASQLELNIVNELQGMTGYNKAFIDGGKTNDSNMAPFFPEEQGAGHRKAAAVIHVNGGHGQLEQSLIAGAKLVALDYASAQVIQEVLKGELKVSNMCQYHISLLNQNQAEMDSITALIPPTACGATENDPQIDLLKQALIAQVTSTAPSKVLICEALVRAWNYHQLMFASSSAFNYFKDDISNEIQTDPNASELKDACGGKLSKHSAGDCLAGCLSGDRGCTPVYLKSYLAQYQTRMVSVVGRTFWPTINHDPLAILNPTWSTGGALPNFTIDSIPGGP